MERKLSTEHYFSHGLSPPLSLPSPLVPGYGYLPLSPAAATERAMVAAAAANPAAAAAAAYAAADFGGTPGAVSAVSTPQLALPAPPGLSQARTDSSVTPSGALTIATASPHHQLQRDSIPRAAAGGPAVGGFNTLVFRLSLSLILTGLCHRLSQCVVPMCQAAELFRVSVSDCLSVSCLCLRLSQCVVSMCQAAELFRVSVSMCHACVSDY